VYLFRRGSATRPADLAKEAHRGIGVYPFLYASGIKLFVQVLEQIVAS
jgi:hypothetical protein